MLKTGLEHRVYGSATTILTEYIAFTMRDAVETSAVSSSRLGVSLLTVSTFMSGFNATPR